MATQEQIDFLRSTLPKVGATPAIDIPDVGGFEPENAPKGVSDEGLNFLRESQGIPTEEAPSATEMASDIESGIGIGDFSTPQIGQRLGIKEEEVVSGGEEFKQSLQKNIPDAPTIGGAFGALGETLMEAGKNIPASTFTLIKDVASAVASPIDTAKSIGGLAVGLVQKLIPGEQNQEALVDALVNNYAERYGSVEKATETFKKDPIGFLSDTAGLLLAGGGVIKGAGAVTKLNALKTAGTAIVKTGAAIDPLIGASRVGKPIAKALKKSAGASLEKVLAPTKEVTKAKTAKVLPELVKEKITAFSTESFQKQIRERMSNVGKQFDDLIESEGIHGETKTAKLTNVLEEAKKNFMVGDVVVEPKTIKVIEGLQDTLSQFGDSIPNTELRTLNQIWSKTVAKGKRFDITKTSEVLDELDLKKIVTDSMRQELAKTNPKLDIINKKYSFYKNVDDVLSETVRRKKGQAGGLGKKLAFVAGLATGEGVMGKLVSATAMSTFVKTIESTAWRTVSSKLKLKLSESIATGNKAAIADVLRQIEKTKED